MFVFLMCVSLLLPVTTLVIGLAWRNHPPGNVNPVVGYRTNMSMKNQKTWDFAHRYFGRLSLYSGAGMIVPSILIMWLNRHRDYETVSIYLVFVQLAIFILPIIPTERALRRKFDKNGVPRQEE